jgi:methionine biosynthesis protein MetW
MTGTSSPPEDYFRHNRVYAWSCVPPGSARVLDVGCGEGYALDWLRHSRGASWLEGIEIDAAAAQAAAGRVDRIHCGDAENLVAGLAPESFDAVLCLDSLEHMRDPWRVTRELVRCLRPGGTFVACLPNVRHWRVTWPLVLHGLWEYQDEGLLDRTHLRFFTRRSAAGLVEQAGLQIDSIAALGLEKGTRARRLARLSLGMLEPFLEFQYLITARKTGGR